MWVLSIASDIHLLRALLPQTNPPGTRSQEEAPDRAAQKHAIRQWNASDRQERNCRAARQGMGPASRLPRYITRRCSQPEGLWERGPSFSVYSQLSAFFATR
jgi:hypothetical protein